MTEQVKQSIPAHWPDEAALIAGLTATFPGIGARPARECGVPYFQHGAWLTGEANMPDGLEILSTITCSDPGVYDGNVHLGFIDWLEQRGWLIEEYDASMFFVTSKAQTADEDAEQAVLDDLLDQEHEALIVLYRVKAATALHRSKMNCSDDASAYNDKAEHYRSHLAALLQTRRPASPISTSADEAPF